MISVIIPARGQSSLLGKNLRVIDGQSLLGRAIACCQRAALDCPIERVIVSTDALSIQSEAVEHGAEVVRRPEWLASDTATTWDTVKHAVRTWGIEGDIALVQCTAPLMTSADVVNCCTALEDHDAAAVCHESHAFLLDTAGRPVNRPVPAQRRQDCEPQYIVAGSCWAMRRSYFDGAGHLYDGPVYPVVAQHAHYLDVDTVDDLAIARRLVQGGRWGAVL